MTSYIRHGLLAGAIAVVAVAGAAAQTPRPADTQSVEVDPITCWWRTSTSAVRTGEPFGLTLTCMVVDTETTKVVPDLSRLDPSVVQLPPFEVLGGTHPGDLRTPGKRFIQFEYRLRVIAEETFGADIVLPALSLTYRVESKVANGDSVQGRDLNYELPKVSMRVISLVPDDTADIREMPASAFAGIEARESKGAMYRTIATALFGLAGVVLVIAAIGALRRRAPKSEAERLQVSDRAILRGVTRELADVRQQSQGGWSEALIARGLVAARIAASYAAGLPVGQRPKTANTPTVGNLEVGGGMGRPAVLVSGGATPQSVAAAAVPGLEDALRTLTRLHYGRASGQDDGATEALDVAIRVAQAQASKHSLVAELGRRLLQSVTGARRKVWA